MVPLLRHKRIHPLRVVATVLTALILLGTGIVIYLLQHPQINEPVIAPLAIAPIVEATPIEVTPSEPDNNFRLCMVGDNNLATLAEFVARGENIYGYVTNSLSVCDYTIADLETNIAHPDVGTPQAKGYTYKAPISAVDTLKKGGIDMVTLANNHTMDYGAAALLDEMSLLRAAGIGYFGAGENITQAFAPTDVTVENTRIAFIGMNDIENWITNATDYSAGSAYFDEARLTASIQASHAEADLVIIYAQWGEENSDQVNSRQEYFAHRFIDAGADIVVGTGPHLRQMHAAYEGKPIYYSLGNFAVQGFFGWPERSKGDLLYIDVSSKQITATSTVEITIDFIGWPNEPGQNHGAN